MVLSSDYWEQRYAENETGWDIGAPSTPIKTYIDQLKNKELNILIPGCGNAYEAEYLHSLGFKNVDVLDFSSKALAQFHERTPSFPKSCLICDDFFSHHGKYDLIIEQTFFCAIHPSLRKKYVDKCHNLLKSGGKIVGLLFNAPLNEDHPPFGGNMKEYLELFEGAFTIQIMEEAFNSIEPRKGRELFIKLRKNAG